MPTATEQTSQALLDPQFVARLDQLEIVARKIFRGTMRGERRSKRRGQSVEFADYRSYVVGDDLRFLDWNIYARLDSLFLKLYLQEEDLHVNILLDTSRSMQWGKPDKGLYARRVAAALAYIGLVNFDRVSLYAYSEGLQYELAGVRGRRLMFKVVEFLTTIPYEGVSHLEAAAKQFAIRNPQPSIVLVLSDFLEKGGYAAGLKYLMGRRYEIYLMHLLSPEEIDPPLGGDLSLQDVEDDDQAEVTISRALLQHYKKTLQAYCGELQEYCKRRGINYLFTSTKVPFDQVVLSYFRSRGLIR